MSGGEPPAPEALQAVRDIGNARSPEDQAAQFPVAPDAVTLLTGTPPTMAGWAGRKSPEPRAVAVTTTGPDRSFTLDTGGVTLDTGGVSLVPGPAAAAASLTAPAEAFPRQAPVALL